MGASFKPIWDIFLAKVNIATIDYSRGKRIEGVADFRYRGSYWDCFIVGIIVGTITMDTTACCGIVLLLGVLFLLFTFDGEHGNHDVYCSKFR
jgi:hypothetical protein